MKSKNNFLKNKERFLRLNQTPTNKSLSKQTHSFQKSPRFKPTVPVCPESSYTTNQNSLIKMGISIGYGKKSDFTKDLTSSPGVGKYFLKHFCEINTNKKMSIGLSRQKIVYRSYINKQHCRNPSASRYSVTNDYLLSSPKYSIGKRTKILDKSKTIQPQNQNPGPAQYNKLPQIFNNKSNKISNSRRFERIKTESPGPAYYSDFDQNNKYILSVSHRSPASQFNKSVKKSLIDDAIKVALKVPGPGSYRCGSQFGDYQE